MWARNLETGAREARSDAEAGKGETREWGRARETTGPKRGLNKCKSEKQGGNTRGNGAGGALVSERESFLLRVSLGVLFLLGGRWRCQGWSIRAGQVGAPA